MLLNPAVIACKAVVYVERSVQGSSSMSVENRYRECQGQQSLGLGASGNIFPLCFIFFLKDTFSIVLMVQGIMTQENLKKEPGQSFLLFPFMCFPTRRHRIHFLLFLLPSAKKTDWP